MDTICLSQGEAVQPEALEGQVVEAVPHVQTHGNASGHEVGADDTTRGFCGRISGMAKADGMAPNKKSELPYPNNSLPL